jgi:hypothetical protein
MDEVKLPAGWDERIGTFARAVGKDPVEIATALEAVIGPPSDEALAVLADESASPFEDLKAALGKTVSDITGTTSVFIPSGLLKKNINLLRGPKKEIPITVSTGASLDILPPLPSDESFLAALKAGGELKVGNTTDIICAMKAALANRVGLYDLPEKIRDRMETFAEDNEEPCGADFFKLRKLITSRSYADVLEAIGVEGSFVTSGRKNTFLAKLDENLWSSLYDFHTQLTNWQQAWMQGGNPAMIGMVLAAAVSPGSTLPPGLMAPPDASGLRDAAEGVINKINKVFAGVGIPISRALAYEASRIKEVLENTSLPASVGATNKEQMLKMFHADIAADYVRLEMNVTRYALAIMELPKITAGQQETVYLGAMLQLGLSISWEKLTSLNVSKKKEHSAF